jgi:hypothetical protein
VQSLPDGCSASIASDEFEKLTDYEVTSIKAIVRKDFEGFGS